MTVAVNFKGGASIGALKPVFSANGESVFVASKSSVLEYNTKTGKLLYEYKGWDNDVIGLSFSTIDNIECVVACCKRGKVIVWKTAKRVKLLETEIPKHNIKSFNILRCNLAKGLNVLITYNTKSKDIAFALINLKKLEEQRIILKIPKRKYALDVCQDKYLAAVTVNNVYFVNLETFKVSSYSMASNNRKFTCVACHPQEEIVLTGDDTGRIVLWQSIFKKKSQAVFHWHTLPVNCIAFSNLGSYFYSGANESVLVKWQIDNPNQKQFLPRLPSGIGKLTVSNNNAFIAVTTSDNAIRIVDSRLNQISLIQHLVLGKQFESGIIYDPVTRALVMNGNVGCVQFYSPNDMSLLYNVDIVNQNKITDERDCKLQNTDVRKIALSKSGKWLATVEERKELKICKELRLKFWLFNSEKQMYELNTLIELPHESSVSKIAFQPLPIDDDLKCITIGEDRLFKIWQLCETATVHRTGPIWKCVNIGDFRRMPCRGLAFSMDGSLFAIGFGTILTIWASDNCELKSSLVHSRFQEKINFVEFGQGNQCHLVAVASKSLLSVWNILSLTMNWVVSLGDVRLLIFDPLSTFMSVVCGGKKGEASGQVIIFEPASPKALYSIDNFKGNGEIIAAAFVPSLYNNDTRLRWYERTNLYFITETSELYCISKNEEPYESGDNYIEEMTEDTSIFTRMKPQVQRSEVKRSSERHMFPKDMGYKSYRQYLEAPVETLPPVRLLAVSLLKSLVLQRDCLQQCE